MAAEAKLEQGKFIHVVATVDLGNDSGAIRYVNPASSAMRSDQAGHRNVELSVEDASGAKRKTWHPIVRFASPDPESTSKPGLIQEDIPHEPWMSVVRLLVNGKEVAKYEAGELAAPRAAMLAGASSQPAAALALDPASPARPNRRALRLDRDNAASKGVTYTIQVRPEGAKAWQTIAVGRPTPDSTIDRNQFPGSRRVDVRVLGTTGFDEHVMAEKTFDLGD